nr:beta-lactamase family protein [Lacticaseibacillus saniviri]
MALDTSIATWLPAFTQPTTFRQALTHTSGLAGYIPHRDELAAPALKQALLTQLTTTVEVDQKSLITMLICCWWAGHLKPCIRHRFRI